MAQGKFKAPKVNVPGRKKDTNKKKTVIKKGSFQIAPKKKRLIESAKLKKTLEKGIKACIEEELTVKTAGLEPKSLAMLKPSTSSNSKSSKSNIK